MAENGDHAAAQRRASNLIAGTISGQMEDIAQLLPTVNDVLLQVENQFRQFQAFFRDAQRCQPNAGAMRIQESRSARLVEMVAGLRRQVDQNKSALDEGIAAWRDLRKQGGD